MRRRGTSRRDQRKRKRKRLKRTTRSRSYSNGDGHELLRGTKKHEPPTLRIRRFADRLNPSEAKSAVPFLRTSHPIVPQNGTNCSSCPQKRLNQAGRSLADSAFYVIRGVYAWSSGLLVLRLVCPFLARATLHFSRDAPSLSLSASFIIGQGLGDGTIRKMEGSSQVITRTAGRARQLSKPHGSGRVRSLHNSRGSGRVRSLYNSRGPDRVTLTQHDPTRPARFDPTRPVNMSTARASSPKYAGRTPVYRRMQLPYTEM